MLTLKQIIILVLLCAVPLTFNLIRPDLFGTDTYYFYAVACENVELRSVPIISAYVFSIMPCSILVFKLISFGLLTLTVLSISFLGSMFSKRFGWLAGVFLFLNSLTILEFSRLEDDTFALPILFTAMYLFLLGAKESKSHFQLSALGLVLFSGLIWKGAFTYLIAFALTNTVALIAFILVMIFIVKNFIGAVMAFNTNFEVAENLPIIGVAYQLFLLIGILGTKRFFVIQLAFFLFIAFINAKFAIHLAPLLALGMVFVTEKLFKRIEQPVVVQRNSFLIKKYFVPIVLLYAFVIAGATGYLILNQFPSSAQTEAVNFAIEIAGDKNMLNDWSYGYYILAAGGNTGVYGGGWPIYYSYTTKDSSPILLTEAPNVIEQCKLLREWDRGGFDNATIRVYNCGTD